MIGKLLKLYLAVEGIAVRDFAAELGVSAATVSRITRGEQVDQNTMLKLMTWLFGKCE
jgi:transcriptional regulator with XRE-family HTH domain